MTVCKVTEKKRNSLIACTLAGVFSLGICTGYPASGASSADSINPRVSINALMVTMIDHSAHHIWDYQALNRELSEQEWQIVEYFGIQLAGSGPLITLGGTGDFDNTWIQSPQWRDYSDAMASAATLAMDAARTRNRDLLDTAGNALITSCEGCHAAFKPASPTEGILHNPQYDHLYHIFE